MAQDIIYIEPRIPGSPDDLGEPTPPKRTKPAEPIKTTNKLKRAFLWLLAIVGLVLILSLGWIGWKFVRDTAKISGGNIFGLLSNAKLNGEDQGRVNILLAGDSADDPGHGGADLTDSIMVVSINTKNNTAFMLSIPRDLWVDVPGHGYQKINAAYEDGGMSLLEQVVDQDFGLKMNYYALVDYTAFKSAVNAVGGITVNIQSPDPRGIYDPNISAADDGPLILKNGVQQLNGQTALNLARARNDPTPSGLVGYGLPNGDFDRAANQRLMLEALESKALSTGVWTNPIKVGQLLDSLGNNVTTNFQTNQLLRLYALSKELKPANIKSVALTDKPLIQSYTTSDGQSALVPDAGVGNYTGIQLYIRQLTSTDPVVQEGATAVVLNGSGVTGLAKKEADALIARGVDVTTYATASEPYASTTLVDNSDGKFPATLSALNSMFHPTPSATTSAAKAYDVDFVIILGANASTESSPTP